MSVGKQCHPAVWLMSMRHPFTKSTLSLPFLLSFQAEAALDTLNKKDLGEAKSLKKPPQGVDDITVSGAGE